VIVATVVSRFAPSTTGPAHLGTLAAAILCWLDARSRGERLVLRLEDLDRDRCRPAFARAILDDLTWLGLDWDEVVEQHTLHAQHEAAMERLEQLGALYPCSASREELRAIGRRMPDGGYAYDNRGRGRPLPPGGWRACRDPIRVQLPDGGFSPGDEGGLDLSGYPSIAFGDQVVRRRDGAFSYQLAVVVDDAAADVSRVVRGRDIAPSTMTQAALQSLLGLSTPVYRHHLLLLVAHGEKLAKSRGSARAVAQQDDARRFCGALALGLGLLDRLEPVLPAELVASFDWARVSVRDRVVRWADGVPVLEAAPGDVDHAS
jgi:glutamyl/glutaminyl-tRNA synthetase